jgi:hypothetical protein
VYERTTVDRFTKQYVKRPGWDTNAKTRAMLFKELRRAVRKETCRIKSRATLSECRTLHEAKPKNKTQVKVDSGKIEARPGKKDDGVMGFGIAHTVALEITDMTRKSEDDKRKETPMMKRFERKRLAKVAQGPFAPVHIHGGN